MLVLSGPAFRHGELKEATIYDVAPTVLALFDEPVPRSWPGRVLEDALSKSFLAGYAPRYREDDPVAPKSAYGRTKLRGEELAVDARYHLVVRTAWLYGRGGRNFVEAIRGQIVGGAESLKVVADQRGSPTYCDDLAEAVLDLMKADINGVVHAVNTGETTWHGFAVAVSRLLGLDVEVLQVKTGEFPRPASRPAYSVLDTSRLSGVLGRSMPPWEDALARYLEASCAS